MPAATDQFEREAARHVRDSQDALARVLADAGLGGARPTELGRQLGVDKTLAWKLARFTGNDDPAAAVKHLPGAGGVEIVCKAAEVCGVGTARVETARRADQRLRAFMRAHAGDRRAFEAMLAADTRDPKLEFEERRAYYKAGSVIWGVRARLQFLVLALRPSESVPGMLDAIQLSGLIGFERLRTDLPWIFRRLRASSDGGGTRYTVDREPLDPAGVQPGGGTSLFPGFCSTPLPAVRQFEDGKGWVYDEIAPGPVGRDGAVSIVSGEIYRAVLPYVWAEDNREAKYLLTVRTPVEAVQLDVLLHESLAHWSHPTQHIAGQLENRPAGTAGEDADRAPAADLGTPVPANCLRLPAYGDMIGRAMELAGWEGPGAFHGHRSEAEFPAPPCDLSLRFRINSEGRA